MRQARQAAVSATEAKNRFADVLGRAIYGHEPVIVEKKGKPVAVVISFQDFQALKKKDTVASGMDLFLSTVKKIHERFPARKRKKEKTSVDLLREIRLEAGR
ncbi:MAG: type II toxin-antitoxin system Phd/YefM family antitoxin [Deltaproteobacteria bacterium]|nr:type II toxin-antitoxin system Phd/YefM family antitoxin [Deltaproteobacteria bacterium]